MSAGAWSPVSLAVVSAGVGHPHPTRLLADWGAEAVCRSLAAGGARAEVEVLELHRLTADLARHTAHGHVSLDLREAIAAIVGADGLVVATPVLTASPNEVSTRSSPPSGAESSPACRCCSRSTAAPADSHPTSRR
ncbi:NAD(P)H-dependent oxidoreductase [Streptomyces umbrinus]|uniref:NAD(P)H-dependent oxidoreductase n=1 Tax=Streptomyces umbrinus TaxID=67370 RepID=UPI003C2C91C4